MNFIEEIEKAYYMVHNNLAYLPERYCFWKKRSIDGKVISKTLSGDYRPIFCFVRNPSLRNNLAELRMCLDYHHSLYRLHKPGLIFGWQHKLVLCQITASIYEGLLFDLFEYQVKSCPKNSVLNFCVKQKLTDNRLGFGALIEIFFQTHQINEKWYNYLIKLKHVRDTVHPKSLNNPRASFKENIIVRGSVGTLIKNLDSFIKNIKKKY